MAYFGISDLAGHNITSRSEAGKTLSQHHSLKTTLLKSGLEVLEIRELKFHPNSVFTRDTSLVTTDGYIKLRMGLESRRGEEDWMAKYLETLGIKSAGSITGNGTVEGGDVILSSSFAFLGLSGRTNKEGVRQITAILRGMNYEVRTVRVPEPFLHLGGAMSVLSPEVVLCCQEIFPESYFEGFNKIEVPRDNFVSGNLISLGNNTVIAEQTNTKAVEILEQKGYHCHSLDLSEFLKGTGGPSCLVLPV